MSTGAHNALAVAGVPLSALVLQLAQAILVLAVAPLVAGFVRTAKARLLGRRGPPPWQPYLTLRRLLVKEALVVETASPLYTAAPAIVFVLLWLAAALVPTFTTELALAPAADLIVLIGLLAAARFVTVLAALDAGTAFAGIGASREITIAALAEPAMLMVVFTVAILFQTTSLGGIVDGVLGQGVGLRVSLALALVALVMVSLAEAGRLPVDNPSTHLELTMVHEAMVLDYSGRHLALMETAGMLRLLVFLALIGCLFLPFGMARPGDGVVALPLGLAAFAAKLVVLGGLLAVLETIVVKMRFFRVPEFLGGALLLGLLAAVFLFVSTGV